jgi:rfaE bifunctional protein kinase chain/domain
MLTYATLEHILGHIPTLAIGVLGDLFLDRYLDIDAALTEPSLETGLDAFQVVRVRSSPGAAGTVVNNLAALGVKQVAPLAVIGDDGEGYELTQALRALACVDGEGIISSPQRRTPTYTKPMLEEAGQPARELNRLDIKNRKPLPEALENRLLDQLTRHWARWDALVVLDQVQEAECGVVTSRVRERLGELARNDPGKFVLADSRERIGLFRSVAVKPNQQECLKATGRGPNEGGELNAAIKELAGRVDRPVFCTLGQRGLWLADPRGILEVTAFPVTGPIDVVGAGDSTSAGIVCAVAAGAALEDAAAFGNLVASITIQQLGTTGIASPQQVRERWREVHPSEPEA